MTAPGEPLPAAYGEHLMSVDNPSDGAYFADFGGLDLTK